MSRRICTCNNLDQDEIEAAIAAGARTLEDVFERLDCQIFCGACLVEIDELRYAAQD